jgi:ribosomal protein L28
VKVSTRILRTIDKLGFTAALKKYNMSLQDMV